MDGHGQKHIGCVMLKVDVPRICPEYSFISMNLFVYNVVAKRIEKYLIVLFFNTNLEGINLFRIHNAYIYTIIIYYEGATLTTGINSFSSKLINIFKHFTN